MNRELHTLSKWIPTLLYMALIYYLSSLSNPFPLLTPAPDYVLHAIEYFVLYLLVYLALHEGLRRSPGRGSFWVPALFAVVYGMLDEYHQSFVPNRDASIHDVLADMVGIGVGVPVLVLSDRVMDVFRGKETKRPRAEAQV